MSRAYQPPSVRPELAERLPEEDPALLEASNAEQNEVLASNDAALGEGDGGGLLDTGEEPDLASMTPQEQYAYLQAVVEARGGDWTSEAGELNLIGFRGMGLDSEVLDDNSGNVYNDSIYAVRMVEGPDGELVPEVHAFAASTDYGTKRRQDEFGRLLVPGSYDFTINSAAQRDGEIGVDENWQVMPLNQAWGTEMPYAMDVDGDKRVTDADDVVEGDRFGFAIHPGNAYDDPVNGASWGCQVIPTTGPNGEEDYYGQFYDLLTEDPRWGEQGETMTYTLVDGQEIGAPGEDLAVDGEGVEGGEEGPTPELPKEIQDAVDAYGDDPQLDALFSDPAFVEMLSGLDTSTAGLYPGYNVHQTPEEAVARGLVELGRDMEADDRCLAWVSSLYAYGHGDAGLQGDTAIGAFNADLEKAGDGTEGYALGETAYRDGDFELPLGAPVFFDDGKEGSPGHVAIATGQVDENGEPLLLTTFYGEERDGEEYPVTVATLSEIEGAVEGRTVAGFVQMPEEEGGDTVVVPMSHEAPPEQQPAAPAPTRRGGPIPY